MAWEKENSPARTRPSLSPVLSHNSRVDWNKWFSSPLKNIVANTLFLSLCQLSALLRRRVWWFSALRGEGERRPATVLPAPHPPRSAPSFLIRLTAPSHHLISPFHNFKAELYPLPLGRSCPSLDHTDIHTLFTAIRPPRSALNLHFLSLRRHCFSFSFSILSFPPPLLLFSQHTAHGAVNCSLAGALPL